MRKVIRYCMLLACLAVPFVQVNAQQNKAAASKKKNEQLDKKHKKEYEKARKQTIKHRRDIQTADTRKRMDAIDTKADANNSQYEKKWYQKIFKKKKRK